MTSVVPSTSDIMDSCSGLHLGDDEEFGELVLLEMILVELPVFQKWTLVGRFSDDEVPFEPMRQTLASLRKPIWGVTIEKVPNN